MSYNRNYGRGSHQQNPRYNNAGIFVPSGELNSPSAPGRTTRATAAASFSNLYPSGSNPPAPQSNPPLPSAPANINSLQSAAQQFPAKAALQNYGNSEQQYGNTEQSYGDTEESYDNTENDFNDAGVAPKTEVMETENVTAATGADNGSESRPRPPWMKAGVKKISNKERRRRQNEHLRKLLTPKNALMVLNEMMPGEQVTSNFTVEAAPPNSKFFRHESGHKFCAGLALEGQIYKGFGENKLTARNAAAEQAIRDLVIKRMSKALGVATSTSDIAEGSGDVSATGMEVTAEGADASDPLPMIQLASYALHKLFSEWQCEGFQVPLLKRTSNDSTSGEHETISPPVPKTPKKSKVKELPADADKLHPSMVITYMRPGALYHELGSEGNTQENMTFTMGVTIDGTTYIGKAFTKKEARKQASRSACKALFNLHFPENA